MTQLREKYRDFFYYLETGKVAISYWPKYREFVVSCKDGFSSIVLQFCPWSGEPFPRSVRDEWFSALDDLGLDPDSDDLPDEFLSEKWWQDRGI